MSTETGEKLASLQKEPLRSAYEVIVIGSGIGGLTAASLLAARGKDVLVLEQHYLPGGSAQTFPYRQYRFDVGPKLFFGMDGSRGNMRYHQQVFDEIGEYPELSYYDTYYSFLHPRGVLRVTGSVEAYIDQLVAAFPDDEPGIRQFYAVLEELHSLFMEFPNFPLDSTSGVMSTVLQARPDKLARLIYWSFVPLGKLFDRHIRSRELRAIINAEFVAFCYSDIDDAPAVLAALVLIERHKGGGAFTKGGSGELARLLVRGLQKHGGRIQYRTMVQRIIIQNGQARGVELTNGEVIWADYIISNAGVVNTFGRTGTNVPVW
ncbi:MAG: FAD-dependent oxidoreductase [Chloroflexaceae bacterium]|nr:FAD-dependent oxidoreductase [Chloroflexaceae bacterium]